MAKPDFQFYHANDLRAASNMLGIHHAKFKAAIDKGNWPGCCAALRAMADEAENATSIAAALGLHAHVEAMRNPNGGRFSRASTDEAEHHG